MLLALFTLAFLAQDPVFSGPQPGEKLTPFPVLAVAGPDAGKEVTLLGKSTGAPTLLVFVHEVTRPGFQLLRPLDQYGVKLAKDGFVTHFVWLAPDRTKAEEFLKRASKSLNLRSPLGIALDGAEGPGGYGLNRKVTLTILVAKDNKVVANFAIVQPNETDAPKVLAAMAKTVGQQPPSLKELLGDTGTAARPVVGKPNADPELQRLMRRMINKANDEAAVADIARDMVKWAGDDAKKKAQMKEYCKMIVKLGYGTPAARKALQRLAGD